MYPAKLPELALANLGPRTCCSIRMQLQGGPVGLKAGGVPGLTCCSLRMQLQGASLGDRGKKEIKDVIP